MLTVCCKLVSSASRLPGLRVIFFIEKVYSLLSAPTEDTLRLVELALLQGSAGQRMAKGLAKYYKKVRCF